MGGWRNTALVIAPSGCLAWAYALWPFGLGAVMAGGVCGAVAGVYGARPVARLADRASADGGLRRWSAAAAVLVGLWLALVIAPSAVGAVARSYRRAEQTPNQALQQTGRHESFLGPQALRVPPRC